MGTGTHWRGAKNETRRMTAPRLAGQQHKFPRPELGCFNLDSGPPAAANPPFLFADLGMSAFNFSILHGRLHANLSQAFPSFRVQCPRHKNPGCFHPRRGQFHEVNEQFVQQGSTVRDYDISAFTGHSFTVNADITLKIPAASLSLLDDAVPLTYICQDLSKHADTSLSSVTPPLPLPADRCEPDLACTRAIYLLYGCGAFCSTITMSCCSYDQVQHTHANSISALTSTYHSVNVKLPRTFSRKPSVPPTYPVPMKWRRQMKPIIDCRFFLPLRNIVRCYQVAVWRRFLRPNGWEDLKLIVD
ncbi:hypothetical protein B0H11DRAFT_2376315 [Mycena galericulata]|nr:hypothetical protein B0H11DRAFT_2376315 [Mycena galericulata]